MKKVILSMILMVCLVLAGCFAPSEEEMSEKMYSYYMMTQGCYYGDNVIMGSEEKCKEAYRCMADYIAKNLPEEDKKIFYDAIVIGDEVKTRENFNNFHLSSEADDVFDNSVSECGLGD